MALKNKTVDTETEAIITETDTVKKDFLTQYSKPLIYGLSALILLVGGWYGYKKLVSEPKEVKAAEAVFAAENLTDKMINASFSKDSLNTALNGGTLDGTKITGLLKVIKDYGGTLSANRACYLVGAAYLQTKEFDKAIKYLNDFDSHGAYQTEIKKYIMLGHANSELKKTEEAFSDYKKATTINTKDEALTADALSIAASYASSLGKSKDAIELYQNLKDNYPNFQGVASGEVDKNLAKLGVTK
jgi:tetratricopeptide (TPR) repeat protein